MPISQYKLVVAANSEALTEAVNAGGYAPVGDVMASACGSYAVQAAGVGTFDVGSATDYEVIQGESRQDLEDKVNTKIGDGLQPVGGVIQWHNAFIQVVGTVTAGGGGGGSVAWGDVTGKPATFPPAIGTTATTAKAGNYAPAWGDVTGKPATFPPAIGTTATTAKAGNYVPSWGDITGKPAVIAAGADAAAARTAIGAGTSNLAIGTTATTAKAGNYVPAWGDITGKPATFAPVPATDTVVGGVKAVDTPTITFADPPDSEDIQTQITTLLNALKSTGIFK